MTLPCCGGSISIMIIAQYRSIRCCRIHIYTSSRVGWNVKRTCTCNHMHIQPRASHVCKALVRNHIPPFVLYVATALTQCHYSTLPCLVCIRICQINVKLRSNTTGCERPTSPPEAPSKWDNECHLCTIVSFKGQHFCQYSNYHIHNLVCILT